jgi:hypothetical protein
LRFKTEAQVVLVGLDKRGFLGEVGCVDEALDPQIGAFNCGACDDANLRLGIMPIELG